MIDSSDGLQIGPTGSPKYVLKRVSGMELGQGAKSMMVPLNVLVCADCGNILEDDIKGYKLEKDLETETKNNNGNLIIK